MTLYQVDHDLAGGTFAVETTEVNGAPLRIVRASSSDQLHALIAYERDLPTMLLRDREPCYDRTNSSADRRRLAVA